MGSRFERMHHQIELAEAEAEALGELYESAEASLEAEIESASELAASRLSLPQSRSGYGGNSPAVACQEPA